MHGIQVNRFEAGTFGSALFYVGPTVASFPVPDQGHLDLIDRTTLALQPRQGRMDVVRPKRTCAEVRSTGLSQPALRKRLRRESPITWLTVCW